MFKFLPPPRGIFVSTELIFHDKMDDRLKATLFRLMSTAWSSPTRTSPPLTVFDLARLVQLSPHAVRESLAKLHAEYAALSVHNLGDGRLTLSFAEWLYPPTYRQMDMAARPAG